jgi:hypothetical protein
MAEQTIHVGFGDYQEALRTDVPEVIDTVGRGFREMLVPETPGALGQLEAYWDCGRYSFRGGGQPLEALTSKTHFIKHVFSELRLKFINHHSSLLWFHAGAAAHHGRAVLILGPRGRGKSTIVTRLCADGWAYLSDDITPVDPGSDRAVPFPIAPAVREDPGREMPLESLLDVRKTDVDLRSEAVCREATPVAALVFPAFSQSARSELTRCSPATAALELLRNCLNFMVHQEIALSYFCDLVQRVPAFCLTYSSAGRATELLARSLDDWDSTRHEIHRTGDE